jgi:hypothetical protein
MRSGENVRNGPEKYLNSWTSIKGWFRIETTEMPAPISCTHCGRPISWLGRLRGRTRFCSEEHRELHAQAELRAATDALAASEQAARDNRVPAPAGRLALDLTPPVLEFSRSRWLLTHPRIAFPVLAQSGTGLRKATLRTTPSGPWPAPGDRTIAAGFDVPPGTAFATAFPVRHAAPRDLRAESAGRLPPAPNEMQPTGQAGVSEFRSMDPAARLVDFTSPVRNRALAERAATPPPEKVAGTLPPMVSPPAPAELAFHRTLRPDQGLFIPRAPAVTLRARLAFGPKPATGAPAAPRADRPRAPREKVVTLARTG